MNAVPILAIEDLTVSYRTGTVWLDAVREVSMQIEAGQTYGLVGESGSGKSTLALAVMGYLSADGEVTSGKIEFDGRDLLKLSAEEIGGVWGAQLALVPQDPYASLNPAMRIGEQLAELLRQHQGADQITAEQRAQELLDMVKIADAVRVARSYPHQISGGMQQRVLIAMALSTQPRLLVLDEPTTGLDVTTEAAVLDLFRDLIKEQDTAALYVTHNLGVVAGICDRVAVLYASELVEDAPTDEIYRQPLHPYTRGLLDSVPRIGQHKGAQPLEGIAGQIPALGELPDGCVFATRCPVAVELCHEERPVLESPIPGRRVRCHRWPEILAGEVSARREGSAAVEPTRAASDETALQLEGIEVHFPLRRSLREILGQKKRRAVKAVDGLSLRAAAHQTLGIVGESGSGKTSLARAVIGLAARTGGEMQLLGLDLPPKLNQRSRDTLRHLQIVFQNPEEALNPYLSIGESLSRPLITLLERSKEQAASEAVELLDAVGLPQSYALRFPGQLSGGEKQRVAIARAFAANPDLLLADEPVSALDVSVQASILNLLTELQGVHSTTTVFISHDIAVVAYLADEVAVMYLGKIMQTCAAGQLFSPPYHPYTEALLSAIPVPDPTAKQERIRLPGDIPSGLDAPTGCPFHTRCPRSLGEVCVDRMPPWQESEDGKRIFCHIPLDELALNQERIIVWEGGE